MKKIIIGIVAIAMLAIPSIASADVARCEASVTANTTVTTATFTALQPQDTITSSTTSGSTTSRSPSTPNSTFIGTSTVYGQRAARFAWAEQVTGTFNADQNAHQLRHHPSVAGATFNGDGRADDNTSVDVAVHLDG